MSNVDGIINFSKPTGITSAKAVYGLRSITGQRKIGHAGTLDPGATGVLVVCLGKATKLTELLMDLPKVYRTTMRLDVTSESLDADSELQPVTVDHVPDREAIEQSLRAFEGFVEQVPPVISAVKVGGQPAYKRARRGQAVELSARRVRIDRIRVHAYRWPELDIEVACGRGTYIRALARDLGARLGIGGCLTSLSRTRVGPFRLEDGWTNERLRQASGPGEYLLEFERAEALLRASRNEVIARADSDSHTSVTALSVPTTR